MFRCPPHLDDHAATGVSLRAAPTDYGGVGSFALTTAPTTTDPGVRPGRGGYSGSAVRRNDGPRPAEPGGGYRVRMFE